MLTMISRLSLILTTCVALGGCAGLNAQKQSSEEPEAESEPATIVVILKGKKTAKVRAAIEELLGEQYNVVPSKRYRKTARKLKAKRLKPSHVAKVAKKIGVDAVVTGTLSKKRKKRYILKLRVRDAATGKTIEKLTVQLRSRTLKSKHERKIIAGLSPALDELGPEPVEDEDSDIDDDTGDDEPDTDTAIAKSDKSKPAPAKKRKPEKVTVAKTKKDKAKKDKPEKVTVAKKAPKPKPEPKPPEPEEEEAEFEDLRYDEEGQIVDEEVPSALK